MFGVHIQSYRLCLSESKHKTKKCGYFRGHFQFFFYKIMHFMLDAGEDIGTKEGQGNGGVEEST